MAGRAAQEGKGKQEGRWKVSLFIAPLSKKRRCTLSTAAGGRSERYWRRENVTVIVEGKQFMSADRDRSHLLSIITQPFPFQGQVLLLQLSCCCIFCGDTVFRVRCLCTLHSPSTPHCEVCAALLSPYCSSHFPCGLRSTHARGSLLALIPTYRPRPTKPNAKKAPPALQAVVALARLPFPRRLERPPRPAGPPADQ